MLFSGLLVLALLACFPADSLLQQNEFSEIKRIPASEAASILSALPNKPFVIEGLLTSLNLFSELRILSDEKVAVAAYTRQSLPHSQSSTRLMPFEERSMRLGELLQSAHFQHFELIPQSNEGNRTVFQIKRKIDLDGQSYKTNGLERTFYSILPKEQVARLLATGSLVEEFDAGEQDLKDGDRWDYGDPIIRLQRYPFTYPTHFDCYHNILVQLLGKKRVVLFPPDSPSNRAGWAEMDELETLFNRSIDDVKWRTLATQATLLAGDAIFIPIHWYHTVENHQADGDGAEFGASINYPLNILSDAYDEILEACVLEFGNLYSMQSQRLSARKDYNVQPEIVGHTHVPPASAEEEVKGEL